MTKAVSAKTLFSKYVTKADRILLVNPPVEETRYSWLRWNQPLDLLKLGAFLRAEVGCKVDLFDAMKPDDSGQVTENWLPSARRYRLVGDMRYPMRRFGQPLSVLKEFLEEKSRTGRTARPTQVWITSLCSYWFETVAGACRVVRDWDKNSRIVLLGNYPRLLPDHARLSCAADLAVTKPQDLSNVRSAFDLYGPSPPPFVAVGLEPRVSIPEIQLAAGRGVYHVAFFCDDICADDGRPFTEIVEKAKTFHRHLRFHVICGLHPQRLNQQVSNTLADRCVAEFHFEEARIGNEFHADAYGRARSLLREAGFRSNDDRVSGFVWIGRPGEKLEEVVSRSFTVVDALGGLILKPFSPTPGSPEHQQNAKYLSKLPLQCWSPHFFPFAELNGITRSEYHDLYRMAAFLYERVRSRAFDFLKGTLGANMLRDSLAREVWNLEPSPFRVTD